eukprot:6459005-Prymnesium_polylepis.1
MAAQQCGPGAPPVCQRHGDDVRDEGCEASRDQPAGAIAVQATGNRAGHLPTGGATATTQRRRGGAEEVQGQPDGAATTHHHLSRQGQHHAGGARCVPRGLGCAMAGQGL